MLIKQNYKTELVSSVGLVSSLLLVKKVSTQAELLYLPISPLISLRSIINIWCYSVNLLLCFPDNNWHFSSLENVVETWFKGIDNFHKKNVGLYKYICKRSCLVSFEITFFFFDFNYVFLCIYFLHTQFRNNFFLLNIYHSCFQKQRSSQILKEHFWLFGIVSYHKNKLGDIWVNNLIKVYPIICIYNWKENEDKFYTWSYISWFYICYLAEVVKIN